MFSELWHKRNMTDAWVESVDRCCQEEVVFDGVEVDDGGCSDDGEGLVDPFGEMVDGVQEGVDGPFPGGSLVFPPPEAVLGGVCEDVDEVVSNQQDIVVETVDSDPDCERAGTGILEELDDTDNVSGTFDGGDFGGAVWIGGGEVMVDVTPVQTVVELDASFDAAVGLDASFDAESSVWRWVVGGGPGGMGYWWNGDEKVGGPGPPGDEPVRLHNPITDLYYWGWPVLPCEKKAVRP